MTVANKKYNPGFLSDNEVIETFCVRTDEFASIMESLRECTGNSNTHTIIIGPRGSGKTHLLLRVVAEVRREASLAGFFPVVFPEESYEVSTIGEFWLECLDRLAEQAPESERPHLRRSYSDIRTTANDRDLADRSLGSILSFADQREGRILLVVENLNMLFSDMADPDAGWRLRQTLQVEPRIILLGSATSRFAEIDNPDHSLYDLFRVVTLLPLDTEECAFLWQAVSGNPSATRAIRPLEILTGGNPRLLAIIARFGAGRTFRELMDDLLDLVDDHTEYFKSHLESLPPQERRVYLALARLWKPATAKEVADQARLGTNLCSSLLKRLEGRGVVVVEGGTARRRQYYLTERLYNIYYLLRRGGEASRVVEALIDFMVCLYSPAELWDLILKDYDEVPSARLPIPNLAGTAAAALIREAQTLDSMEKVDDAIAIYEQVEKGIGAVGDAEFKNQAVIALFNKALLLNRVCRHAEAIRACDRIVAGFAMFKEPIMHVLSISALDTKGMALAKTGNASEAIEAYDQAMALLVTSPVPELDFLISGIAQRKGLALIQVQKPMEAIAAFDQVVERFRQNKERDTGAATRALICKAIVLHQIDGSLNDREFTLLLECLAKDNKLQPGWITVLTLLASRLGPDRALKLIQASPAMSLLLPLVTALQREIGQVTHVAREVDEVAEDIRHHLRELTHDPQAGVAYLPAELTIRAKSEFNSAQLKPGAQ